jgi:hypothetical protein
MPKSLEKPWSRERKEQDDIIINNEELVRIVTGTPAEERGRKSKKKT